MAWTTPKTDWNNGELVTASDMNAIGESLAMLRNHAPAAAAGRSTEDILRNSSTFTDVDSENFNLTIETSGGDVLAHFCSSAYREDSNSAIHLHFDIDVDGVLQGSDVGEIIRFTIDRGYSHNASFTYLIQNLSAGSHIIKLQMKGRGRVRFRAGAQFSVQEI